MIDAILIKKSATAKIAVKSIVALCLIVSAVVLPQIVHIAMGADGGIMLLPMYLPVLVAGVLLGWRFGLGVAVLSPLVSFCLTAIFASPMPALARLPFMIIELSVFATVSGLFSKKISKNSAFSFVAVILAIVAGRLSFLALVAIFESVSVLSVSAVLSQIQAGLFGVLLQATVVPLLAIVLSKFIKKEEANE